MLTGHNSDTLDLVAVGAPQCFWFLVNLFFPLQFVTQLFLSVFSLGYRSCFLPFNSSSKQNKERREGEGQGRRQRQRREGGIRRSSQRLEDSVDDKVGSGAAGSFAVVF